MENQPVTTPCGEHFARVRARQNRLTADPAGEPSKPPPIVTDADVEEVARKLEKLCAEPSDTERLEAVITNSWHIGGEDQRHQAHDYLNNPVTPGEWFETPRAAIDAAIVKGLDVSR